MSYSQDPLIQQDIYGVHPAHRAVGPAAVNISPPPSSFQPSNNHSPLNEKSGGLFHRSGANGFRRSIKPGASARAHPINPSIQSPDQDDEHTITKMGRFYESFFKASTVARYITYIVPLGIILAIPIIVTTTAFKESTIGPHMDKRCDPPDQGKYCGGVPTKWFFTWLLCSWAGLWISKLLAHYLPNLFQFFCGFVSPGVRKYSVVIAALEIPLSLSGWALVSLATFRPLVLLSDYQPHQDPHWVGVMGRILAAALISSLVFVIERLFVQLISINYHRKQFQFRIKDSKHSIYLLSLLYDASRAMFPAFCPEFAEEDAAINDSITVSNGKHAKSGKSGSATPLRLLQQAGKMGDKFTAAFGNMAHEVTGKNMFNPDSAHSVVVEALEKNRSAEALARRIWLSFVVEGNDALFLEDVVEVLGAGRQPEAEECFHALDRDSNGDVSLDEMILTVTEFGRERHAITNSMHDVDQAIKVLDRMLCVVVFVSVVLIFVSFLVTSFYTTLATTGTALLSLSFIFSTTAQEILGSCIFLFVKHPYDIGDRVNLSKDKLVVEHISLLFTVFKRVSSNQIVQIPNIVLNSLWVENVSRSKAMREQVNVNVDFTTSFEDIQLLKSEMNKFVADKENSRDFFPDVDVQVLGVAEMDQLQLQVEIFHKSNWSNEAVRAARRSKFMCALVLALRKIPINAPGGGGPALGDPTNPSYSVAISDSLAQHYKSESKDKKETARMVPTKKPDQGPEDKKGPSESEKRAINVLLDRSPAMDSTRDDPSTFSPDESRNHTEIAELEEVRSVLRRSTLKGKRKSAHYRSLHSSNSVKSTRSVRSARGANVELTNDSPPPPMPQSATKSTFDAPPLPPPPSIVSNLTGMGTNNENDKRDNNRTASPTSPTQHRNKASDESIYEALPRLPATNYQPPGGRRYL